MAGCMYSRLWRLPRRFAFGRRYFYDQSRPLPQSVRGPLQSQLLRFALKRTAQPSGSEYSDSDVDPHLREVFLEEWPTNSQPSPLWDSPSRSPNPYFEEIDRFLADDSATQVQNIQDLQHFVERTVVNETCGHILSKYHANKLERALERCQRHNTYEEILSFMNGLLARLTNLGSRINHRLFIFAIYYASLALSESALIHHLRGYRGVTHKRISLMHSRRIVRALLSSLHAVNFQNAKYDTSRIRQLITGEVASNARTRSLHSILFWGGNTDETDSVGEYMSLLVKVQSDTVLHRLWDTHLNGTHPRSTVQHFQSAYLHAMALVDSGRASDAVVALTQISRRAGGSLPGISSFHDLNRLLKNETVCAALPQLAGEEEYMMVLDGQLGRIESRLGISWHPDRAIHTDVSDALCIATEQPILTIDGDSAGYGCPERLIADIRALGCSKSAADLSKLTELLGDYEGEIFPVAIPSCKTSEEEFYWAPQRSPIKFKSTSTSLSADGDNSLSHSTLGLLKIVRNSIKSPFAREESLHLMQLGHLLTKLTCSSEMEPKESGYIVALDRASGRFLAVFVGWEHETIDSSTQLSGHSTHPNLDAITEITPLNNTPQVSEEDEIAFHGISSPSYSLQVDPSPDLVS